MRRVIAAVSGLLAAGAGFLGIMFLIASSRSPGRVVPGIVLLGIMAICGIAAFKLARVSRERLVKELLKKAEKAQGTLSVQQVQGVTGLKRYRDVVDYLVEQGLAVINEEGSLTFPGLGNRLVVMTCPYCGNDFPVRDDVQFCPSCGGDLKEELKETGKTGLFHMDS